MKSPKHYSSIKRFMPLILVLILCAAPKILFAQGRMDIKPGVFKGKIIYSSEELNSQIMLLNGATGKVSQLTHEGMNLHPQWSPDGKYILYASDVTGEYKGRTVKTRGIYVMRSDGKDKKLLTIGDNPHYDKNNEIYFRRTGIEENVFNIITGQVLTISSYNGLEDENYFKGLLRSNQTSFIEKIKKARKWKKLKDWLNKQSRPFTIFKSHNGQHILLDYPNSQKRMVLIDTTTVSFKQMQGGDVGLPAWSKDSKKVAYAMGDPGNDVLVIYDLKNNQYQQIQWHKSKDIVCGGNLSWSADSNEIVYACGPTEGLEERTSSSYLYIYNFKTKKSTKLIPGDEPDWH